MPENDRKPRPSRRYPPVYEKLVPIALAIIALAVVVVLIIAIGVATGLIPGTG